MCLSWSPASLFSRCVSICSNNAISNALEPHNLALGGVSPQFQNTRPYYAVIAWLMAVFNPITVDMLCGFMTCPICVGVEGAVHAGLFIPEPWMSGGVGVVAQIAL